MKSQWIRKSTNGCAVVFVHGILSNGDNCWRHVNGSYWPELLKNEDNFIGVGIYVYTYETGFFSGTYNLNDIVDDLKEHLFFLDEVANNRSLVFVCHSMGRIVVRKFIVERIQDILDRNIEIGLYLVASPSLGSNYANWLEPIAKIAGHTQAKALRFTQENLWLNGLDREFINLKESRKIKMRGKELIEDKFIILKKFLSRQVVEPFAGARYFGEPYKVPNSDHFSIAKPVDENAVQYRLLLIFLDGIFISAYLNYPFSCKQLKPLWSRMLLADSSWDLRKILYELQELMSGRNRWPEALILEEQLYKALKQVNLTEDMLHQQAFQDNRPKATRYTYSNKIIYAVSLLFLLLISMGGIKYYDTIFNKNISATSSTLIALPILQFDNVVTSPDGLLIAAVEHKEYKIGDKLNIQYAVAKPLYIRLIYVNSSGEKGVFLPDMDIPDVPLVPGVVYHYPPLDAKYEINIEGPKGTDQIILMASDKKLPKYVDYIKNDESLNLNQDLPLTTVVRLKYLVK